MLPGNISVPASYLGGIVEPGLHPWNDPRQTPYGTPAPEPWNPAVSAHDFVDYADYQAALAALNQQDRDPRAFGVAAAPGGGRHVARLLLLLS